MTRPARTRFLGLGPAILIFAGVTLLGGSTADGSGQPAINRAKLSQAGRNLTVDLRTENRIGLRKMARLPDFSSPAARFLCLDLGRKGDRKKTRVCVGGPRNRYRQIGVSRVAADDTVLFRRRIPARVRLIGARHLSVTFNPRPAGLTPGIYRWRASLAVGCPGDPGDGPCVSSYPAARHASWRLRPIRAVGCTGGNGQVILHGPRRGKRVAFTFDDGPGPDTPAVLRVLRRQHVKATFFMLGMQVNLYPSLARRVLAAGHELASHSSVHALLPGYSDIARSVRTIRRKTGFRPCLFRPPYGSTSSSLIASARRARLKTVIWDIDTNDWRLPGSGSIQGTITGSVRPGSIVLMHDAGGPRDQTIDALPGAIRNLRRRGYRFVTVSELLGSRMIYRPVGGRR